ncbi:MAG: MarR family transcriptional regulator [Rhodospirillales bacterium]|nr:MarR family transcriptional regulator [Rhodospirillales bacterium]
MPNDDADRLFTFFTEIGIIAQLSRAAFEARLPDGMTLPHFTVLNHLVRLGDGCTPLALARAFQVPKTSMTNTLSGLERKGLIRIQPNPEDGRSKVVTITSAGRKFRDSAVVAAAETFGPMVEKFPAGWIETLTPQLAEIRAVMDRARDDGPN